MNRQLKNTILLYSEKLQSVIEEKKKCEKKKFSSAWERHLNLIELGTLERFQKILYRMIDNLKESLQYSYNWKEEVLQLLLAEADTDYAYFLHTTSNIKKLIHIRATQIIYNEMLRVMGNRKYFPHWEENLKEIEEFLNTTD